MTGPEVKVTWALWSWQSVSWSSATLRRLSGGHYHVCSATTSVLRSEWMLCIAMPFPWSHCFYFSVLSRTIYMFVAYIVGGFFERMFSAFIDERSCCGHYSSGCHSLVDFSSLNLVPSGALLNSGSFLIRRVTSFDRTYDVLGTLELLTESLLGLHG